MHACGNLEISSGNHAELPDLRSALAVWTLVSTSCKIMLFAHILLTLVSFM